MASQGEQAVQNGEELILTIDKEFDKLGLTAMYYYLSNLKVGVIENSYNATLLSDVPYTNIFGLPGKSPFQLELANGKKYRIEAHGQNAGGTTEQKIPFWLLNVMRYPEPAILILDGAGFRSQAKEWAKLEAAQMNKEIRIFFSVEDAFDFFKTILEQSVSPEPGHVPVAA